jgi:hypothetical protein
VTAGFGDMTLDQSARVEKECRHLAALADDGF